MELLTFVALGYLVIAAQFGLWFVTVGAQRLDSAAAGAGAVTRLLWFPAAALLWPILILRLFPRLVPALRRGKTLPECTEEDR